VLSNLNVTGELFSVQRSGNIFTGNTVLTQTANTSQLA